MTGLEAEIEAATSEEAFNSMPILDAYIDESLRLSSAAMSARTVVGDGYVFDNKHKFRKGDRVVIFPPLLHFDADAVGPDPEEFNHKRYIGSKDGTRKKPLS